MIYIFDKKQAIIKVLTNDDFTAAHLNFKINTATTFEFSLPASKALPSGSKYVATPHPLNDSKFIMLRLTERVDNTETIDYSAYELAYQELATDGYVEDKRPRNQSALNLMKIALNGSNWELNNVNVSGTATTNFYYVDRLSAISKVVDLLGGEIVFYIEIQGNAISGRYMDYLARQGADTSKVFANGSNLLTVERQSDTSNIYTAILPRGKGKEIDNGDADTPDGYGRRINIADVEWKRSAGNPLDKPKGSIVLSDPNATAEWGQINGNARLLLQTYDDIDDVNVLINSAYKTLQSVNHPQVQYSATVADVGGLSLGDTVLIMHGDRDLSYKTRVFEVKYDLLSPDQTELSLGDDLSSKSITSQINNLNAVADTTSSQTQWTINQIGRPSTTFGNTEPANPKVGDVFFKELPDGGTKIYRWNGDIWELRASPTTADDIAKAVNDAVIQAKSHTDEVKQGLVSDIDTAKSQAASLASTAEANAKSEATSLFSRAQNYVDQAKSEIKDTINAISVGGRNLLLGTDTPLTIEANDNDWHFNSIYDHLKGGTTYTFSAEISVSNGQDSVSVAAFDAPIRTTWAFSYNFSKGVKRGSFTFTTPDHIDNDGHFLVYAGSQGHTAGLSATYTHMKLEEGNVPTAWTPAPEDVVLDYTTKDNKIKETITQYKETNDGHVSKLQTSVKTALEQIETKISQTDFNQKTGEISRNANEAKDTADQALRTIGEYQKSNDERVHEAESSIERTARAITEKVRQTDYDNYKLTLNERFTKVEATADGASTTVSKLETKVNNLGQVNQLFNTEFSPDFAGWENGNIAPFVVDGSYNGSVRIRNTATVLGNRLYSELISVHGVSVVSTSVYNDDWSQVRGYDQNKNLIGELRSNYVSGQKLNVMNGIAIPSTVYYIDFGIQSGVNAYISQPMLVFASTVGAYVQGNYNNNAAIAQVKITADGISNFVRDSSGNISSNFQTALSKTSIITGSTLATSIQKQTATQITSALTDNNGKIISLINQDSSGVQIAGKNIVLDGKTTVTGDFYAKGGNFTNLNASNILIGTLNGDLINITNINAGNIVSGSISGANLNINLNTGSVVFQKGRINSSDYTTDINIDQGYISTANSDTRAILKNGQLQLTSPSYYDLQTNPYLAIYNDPRAFDSTGKFNSAVISARDRVIIGNKDGLDDMFWFGDAFYGGQSNFYGLSSGTNIGKATPTTVGGGKTGVVVVGGSTYKNVIGVNDSPSITVGWSPDNIYSGNRVMIQGDYVHIPSIYNRTWSTSSNVYVAADGSLYRTSSARKYKLDIKNNIPIDDSLKLIEVPLSTWVDKREHEENGSNERYFGMIAEDLRDAGLEYLVQYGEDNEVEGINYDRVALLLIPLVKELKERIEELESKGK